MAGGRPRTVSPPPEECIKLGEEMIEWVIQNQPTHLSEWFSIEKMIPWKTWNAMCELPEFLPYYEKALALVAIKTRDKTMSDGVSQRFLSLYHRDLKKEERENAEFNARVKAQSDEEIVQKSIVEKDNLIIQQSKQLLDLQKQLDELKGKNASSVQPEAD